MGRISQNAASPTMHRREGDYQRSKEQKRREHKEAGNPTRKAERYISMKLQKTFYNNWKVT
jgi:hypothetical protein